MCKANKKQSKGGRLQDSVGCSVPHCEATWCDRERKATCALRKYYIYEVARLRKNRDAIAKYNGAAAAERYASRTFFWGRYKHNAVVDGQEIVQRRAHVFRNAS